MKRRVFVLALAALSLTGCSSMMPDPFLTASSRPEAPPIASEVAPQFAVARLPASAGRIRSVLPIAMDNYAQQQIIYENNTRSFGENLLTVEIGSPVYDAKFLRPPSAREVYKVMRDSIPGVKMAIRQGLVQNVQGIYGYATGSLPNGGSCIYGWQTVNFNQSRTPMTFLQTIDRKYHMQVRLRYCDPAIPEERIVMMMDGLRLKPVTADTLAMLKFATGTGSMAYASPAEDEVKVISQPMPEAPRKVVVTRRAASAPAVTRAAPVNLDTVVLPITRRTPVQYPVGQPMAVNPNQPFAVPRAARVPLPGMQPMQRQGIDPTTTAAANTYGMTPRRATMIPLPGMAGQ